MNRNAKGERVFPIADFTREQPHSPAHAPQARALGVGSMMGFLLFTEDEELGALPLLPQARRLYAAGEMAGWLLASHAAVAFSSARTHAQMERAVAMGLMADAGPDGRSEV